MKNLTYFPFERNRYYYGKLLSAADFEAEQRYFNDKRRLGNRLLFGCGVTAGMEVVQIGEEMISVEPGIAMDAAGREIVLYEPASVRLSVLDGYGADEAEELYLYIEYREERINEADRMSGSSEKKEYGASREGYRLYLKKKPPGSDIFSAETLRMQECVVYEGKYLSITHNTERFAEAGQCVEFQVQIEHKQTGVPLSFSYEVELSGLSYEGKSVLKIVYDERIGGKKDRCTFSYDLKAVDSEGVDGSVGIRRGSFRINQKDYDKTVLQEQLNCRIEKKRVSEMLQEKYLAEAMAASGYGRIQEICLARIRMLPAGAAQMIQRIERMPAAQYAASPLLQEARTDMIEKEIRLLKQQMAGIQAERI